jgi:galactokinase
VRALRDVTAADLAQYASELPETILRRCRHVIRENARVLAAGDALERNDRAGFGSLMRESHRSLRDDFEVSCPELDLMVTLAEEAQGVYGARMTGGGFGGCTINLVQKDCVAAFKEHIGDRYERSTGRTPAIYDCSAAGGVRQIG